jgi:hypothetical protein
VVSRRDKSNALTVELGQLPDDNASAVDPVKLCIAYALRIGAVEEKSWPGLLDAVRSRPSKRVLWAKPTSPVFCTITRSNQLDMTKPAMIQQNQRFLSRAAGLIGMLDVPVPHDIRRGAASDVYSLTGSGDLARVGRTLGHSLASMANGVTGAYIGHEKLTIPIMPRGVTDAYIGHEKTDSWSERVAQAPKDTTADLPVDLAPALYKKRRVQTKDIDTYCDDNQLDKTVTKDRERARTALQKQAQEKWTKFQRDLLDDIQQPAPTATPLPSQPPLQSLPSLPSLPSHASGPAGITHSYPLPSQPPLQSLPSLPSLPSHASGPAGTTHSYPLPPQASGSAKTTRSRATAKPQGSATNIRVRATLQDLTNVSGMTSASSALTRKRPSETDSRKDLEQDGAHDNIDPALRTFASDVLGVQIGAASMGQGSSSSTESMVDGCISLLAASHPPVGNELAFLTAPRDEFIGYLSTVNLVCVSTKRTLESDPTGNSRDPPSLFMHYCRKQNCARSFVKALERDEHEVNCSTLSAPLVLDDIERDADEPAPAPRTTKRAYNKVKPGDALKPGFPKVCPQSDICGVTKPFNTRSALTQHKANHHDTTWPPNTPCNFPGCTLPRTSYFTSRNLFRRHLNTVHLQKDAQAKHYIGLIMASAAASQST